MGRNSGQTSLHRRGLLKSTRGLLLSTSSESSRAGVQCVVEVGRSWEEVLPRTLEQHPKGCALSWRPKGSCALSSQRVLGPEALSTILRDGPASLPFQTVDLSLGEQKDLCGVYVGKLGQHELAASFPDTQEVICKFYRGQHFI